MKNVMMQKTINDRIERCYRQYRSSMLKYIWLHVHDVHHAEDIVHDAFARVLRRGPEVDYDAPSFRAYLFSIAKNCALDHLRRRRAQETTCERAQLEEQIINEQFFSNLEQSAIDGEIIATLHDSIESLEPVKRAIIERMVFFNARISEIVKEYQLSRFVVERIIREFRVLVQQRLHGYF